MLAVMSRMQEAVAFAVVATLLSTVSNGQEKTSEIRGSVVAGDQGLPNEDVWLRGKGNGEGRRTVTDESGAFAFYGLPAGHYDLQVGNEPVTVPSPPFLFLQVELNADRGLTLLLPMESVFSTQMPAAIHYFRLLEPGGDKVFGVLTGTVKGKHGSPLEGANVALYISKLGRIATTRTKRGGSFSFPQLKIGENYWVHVFSKGYFDDEITGVKVLAGYESIYDSLTLEPCEPGHCESYLRPIHIVPLPN
jgi:hypothetical protein